MLKRRTECFVNFIVVDEIYESPFNPSNDQVINSSGQLNGQALPNRPEQGYFNQLKLFVYFLK